VKSDIYQVVTDRIISLLESGTIPWHKPWRGGQHTPQNLISRKQCRGINVFLLNSLGYASPCWLTFRQALSLGGAVRKGEKACLVVFWKWFEAEDTETQEKRIPFLRYYHVFNVAQCENLANVPTLEVAPQFEPIKEGERIVAAMPKRPEICHGSSRACYSPREDKVSMPDPGLFPVPESYYCVLFHELTHATGHPTRLNRDGIADAIHFGSDPYSREELVAEMGAAFLCGHCEMVNQTIEHSAGYIQSWLSRLKDDKKLVVQAAAQAQKACDFILAVHPTEHGGPDAAA
jgi:antirestriction protein ArdC